MDRGAWQFIVKGVTKNQTWLHERTATIYIYIYLCSRESIYSYTDLEDPFSNSLLSLLIPMGPFLSPSARNPAASLGTLQVCCWGLRAGPGEKKERERKEKQNRNSSMLWFIQAPFLGSLTPPQKEGTFSDLFCDWGFPWPKTRKKRGENKTENLPPLIQVWFPYQFIYHLLLRGPK